MELLTNKEFAENEEKNQEASGDAERKATREEDLEKFREELRNEIADRALARELQEKEYGYSSTSTCYGDDFVESCFQNRVDSDISTKGDELNIFFNRDEPEDLLKLFDDINKEKFKNPLSKSSRVFIFDLQEYEAAHTLILEHDYVNAIPYLEAAAIKGYPPAFVWLHFIYEYGQQKISKDTKIAGHWLVKITQALSWYETYAKEGNWQASYCLGYLYNFGWGVKKDYEEALNWCELVLKQQPAYIFALHYRGNAFYFLRRYTEALISYEMALAIDPKYTFSVEGRLLCLRQLGSTATIHKIKYLSDVKNNTSFESVVAADFTDYFLSTAHTSALAEVLVTHPSLTHLQVDRSQLQDAGLAALAEALSQNFHLTTLTFEGNLDLTQASVLSQRQIHTYLYRNRLLAVDHVTPKILHGLDFSVLKGNDLRRVLERHPNMQYWDFSAKKLDANAFIFQPSYLPNYPALRKLNLSGNQLRDESAAKIARLLGAENSPLPGLVVLELVSNRIRAEGFYCLAEAMHSSMILEVLDLSQNTIEVSKATLQELGAKFSRNCKLLNVVLSGNALLSSADILLSQEDKPEKKEANLIASPQVIGFFHSQPITIASVLDPTLSINHKQWLVALVCAKKAQHSILLLEHPMLVLEGMRDSGQRFIKRYHLILDGFGKAMIMIDDWEIQGVIRRHDGYYYSPFEISFIRGIKLINFVQTQQAQFQSESTPLTLLSMVFSAITGKITPLTWCTSALESIGISIPQTQIPFLFGGTSRTVRSLSNPGIFQAKLNLLLDDIHLKIADFRNCAITLQEMQTLARALANHTSLTTLRLNFTQMTDRHLVILAEALKNNTRLIQLTSTENSLLPQANNQFEKQLKAYLYRNRLLKTHRITPEQLHNLDFSVLSGADLRHILTRHKNIDYWDFSNKQLYADTVILRPKNWVVYPALTHLNLKNNQLGEKGVKQLVRLLTTEPVLLPSLKVLDLSYNQIHDLGFLVLADAILKVNSLSACILDGNYLSYTGFQSFLQIVRDHPFLERLSLCENRIYETNKEELDRTVGILLREKEHVLRHIDVTGNYLKSESHDANRLATLRLLLRATELSVEEFSCVEWIREKDSPRKHYTILRLAVNGEERDFEVPIFVMNAFNAYRTAQKLGSDSRVIQDLQIGLTHNLRCHPELKPMRLSTMDAKLVKEQKQLCKQILFCHPNAPLKTYLQSHPELHTERLLRTTCLLRADQLITAQEWRAYFLADRHKEHALLAWEGLYSYGQRVLKVAHLTFQEIKIPGLLGRIVSTKQLVISYHHSADIVTIESFRDNYEFAVFSAPKRAVKAMETAVERELGKLPGKYRAILSSGSSSSELSPEDQQKVVTNCQKWALEKLAECLGIPSQTLLAYMSPLPSRTVKALQEIPQAVLQTVSVESFFTCDDTVQPATSVLDSLNSATQSSQLTGGFFTPGSGTTQLPASSCVLGTQHHSSHYSFPSSALPSSAILAPTAVTKKVTQNASSTTIDPPIFFTEVKKDEQLGWNCFDVAIALPREDLVKFALEHKKDPVFRKLLAQEIETASAVTAIIMNMQDEKNENTQDTQKRKKELTELFDLLDVAERFAGEEEVAGVFFHIQKSLEKLEEKSVSHSLKQLALPNNMHTKEVQQLVNAYNDAHEAIKPELAQCNTLLGHPEGKRLSFSELHGFFASSTNRIQHAKAFCIFNEALKKFAPHEKAFHDYCKSEETYEAYINGYYGNKQWVAFIPASSGKQNTSMVDIAARRLDKKIIIHQLKNNQYEEIYRTEYEGCETVYIQYNGHNHFMALKCNPVYFATVEAEFLKKFGFFKPQDMSVTDQPQCDVQNEEDQIAKIVLGYLG